MVADSPSLFQRLRQRVGLGRAKEASVEERSTLVTRAKRLRTPDRHRKRSAHPQRRATLSVPSELLVRPFSANADNGPSRQQIDELSTLVRLQLQHELHESSLWLVDSFDILAGEGDTDGSARLGLIAEGSSALPLSDRVIDGLCALMQRANYRLLSQACRSLQAMPRAHAGVMLTAPHKHTQPARAWQCIAIARAGRVGVRAVRELHVHAPSLGHVGPLRLSHHLPPLRAPPAPRPPRRAARAPCARLPPRRGRCVR